MEVQNVGKLSWKAIEAKDALKLIDSTNVLFSELACRLPSDDARFLTRVQSEFCKSLRGSTVEDPLPERNVKDINLSASEAKLYLEVLRGKLPIPSHTAPGRDSVVEHRLVSEILSNLNAIRDATHE